MACPGCGIWTMHFIGVIGVIGVKAEQAPSTHDVS
jgi:NO-binding membrane sensor protein with MHYT domain